jgi:hypothetical protein
MLDIAGFTQTRGPPAKRNGRVHTEPKLSADYVVHKARYTLRTTDSKVLSKLLPQVAMANRENFITRVNFKPGHRPAQMTANKVRQWCEALEAPYAKVQKGGVEVWQPKRILRNIIDKAVAEKSCEAGEEPSACVNGVASVMCVCVREAIDNDPCRPFVISLIPRLGGSHYLVFFSFSVTGKKLITQKGGSRWLPLRG